MREDDQSERTDVCSLLMALEPLRGSRGVQIRTHGTRQDYAVFMKELAEREFYRAANFKFKKENALSESFDKYIFFARTRTF